MKKFLSLVLALVMTMSLVTVSAGAKDFGDSDKIQYKEAVDVMSAVKVIDGYTDGSFNPTATLTRGAAAKIICNLILGPTTASALVADAAPYSDVPTTNVFAGYIAYCQKEGIISGYADGTFRPANSLTGYAFMKMLLGALGYDAKVEGYTGPNWSVNVAKRALNIGLADDLIGNFNGIKSVNREEACLYALNTLTANMVEYDAKTSVSTGNTTVVIAGSKAKDMENKNANTDGKIFTKDGVMQFAEKYFENLTVKKGSDDFSRPANVWKVKAEEIGTYTDKADLTYTKAVKSSDIYKDLGLGKTMAKSDVAVYINGERVSDADLDLKKGSDDKVGKNYKTVGTKTFDTAQNGVLTEVFYDKDAETVTISQIVTYVGEVQKTVAATDKKDAYITISTKELSTNPMSVPYNVSGGKVSSVLEFETDEKFTDETYVLYTCSFKDNSNGEVKSAVAAQKVEGNVTKTINKVNDEDKNNGITIADTEYKMSCATTGEKLGDVSVKNDYLAYLDQYGYVIYVEEIEEIGNYALVLDTAAKNNFVGKKAELLFTDGTTKVVTTEKNYNTGSNAIADNTIVTYKADADGVYTLKKVKTTSYNTNKTLDLKSDKAGIVVDGTTIHANSATVFVVRDVKDHDDYTSYTGIKNAPSIQTTGATLNDLVSTYYYCKNGDMATVVFLFPGKDVNVEDDANAMLFLSEKDVSDLINDAEGNYFIYHAIVNGEAKDVKVDKDLGNGLSGLYKSYSTNSKKTIITSLKNYTLYGQTLGKNPGDAKEYLEGTGLDKVSKEYTVILDTANTKKTITCDDNAKFFYVDKDGKITAINYNGINPDENDKVYAIVQDYMVKTLIIQEIEDTGISGTTAFSGKYFKAESNIYSTGYATMVVDVTRPAYLDDAKALNYSFDVLVNGEKYDHVDTTEVGNPFNGAVVPAGGNKYTVKWNNRNDVLYKPVPSGATVTVGNFQFTDLTAQVYNVKYFDQTGKELKVADNFVTSPAGTTIETLDSSAGAALKFKLNSTTVWTGTDKFDWKVEGVYSDDGHATEGKDVTVNTAVTNAGKTLKAGSKDSKGNVTPLEDYVKVTLNLSKVAPVPTTYTITNVSGKDIKDYVGGTTTDKITVTATPNSSLKKGDEVTVTFNVDNVTGVYGYKVTLKDKTVVTTDNSTKFLTKFTVKESLDLADEIKVEAIPALTVTKTGANANVKALPGHIYEIAFSEAIELIGEKANITNDNGTPATCADVVAEGNTLIVTLSADVATDKKIMIAADVVKAASGAQNGIISLTLGADGNWTLA